MDSGSDYENRRGGRKWARVCKAPHSRTQRQKLVDTDAAESWQREEESCGQVPSLAVARLISPRWRLDSSDDGRLHEPALANTATARHLYRRARTLTTWRYPPCLLSFFTSGLSRQIVTHSLRCYQSPSVTERALRSTSSRVDWPLNESESTENPSLMCQISN